MQIAFRTAKLAKRCNQFKEACRAWGSENARILGQRLQEIEAAENLEQFCRLPGPDGHPLKGDRKGQWACNLVGLLRLVFVPDGEPSTYLEEGRLVRSKVLRIKVLEVRNYHE